MRTEIFPQSIGPELSGGPDPVTVAAAYVALLELGANGWERARVNEPSYLGALGAGIAMVEFEDDWIRLTAIDARMS
jgi:hypothetical protein